jgi:hypothetical protein
MNGRFISPEFDTAIIPLEYDAHMVLREANDLVSDMQNSTDDELSAVFIDVLQAALTLSNAVHYINDRLNKRATQ